MHLAHLVEQPPTAFREDYMHGFRYETVTHVTEDELGRPTRRPHPFGRRGGRWVSVDGTDYEPADHDEEDSADAGEHTGVAGAAGAAGPLNLTPRRAGPAQSDGPEAAGPARI